MSEQKSWGVIEELNLQRNVLQGISITLQELRGRVDVLEHWAEDLSNALAAPQPEESGVPADAADKQST